MDKKPNHFFTAAGAVFFRYRNFLFPVVFILILIFSKPGLFLGNLQWDEVWVFLGALVALSGQVFRLLVIGYAYIKRGGKGGKVYADDLVIRGFYAHTRNPMYFGNMLIVVGLCMMYGSWFAYFFVIPFFCFVYLSIVVTEEQYLKERFGPAYDDYTKRVNRFLPNFHGLKKSLEEFHYDWKKALRKDYGNVYVTVFLIILCSTWKNYSFLGISALYFGAAAFSCLVLFYCIIRYLKLNGYMVS